MHYTNLISQVFEKFAKHSFHPKIQKWINLAYVKYFNINLEEFDTIESYESLNELFMRSLIKMRSFDKAQNVLIAPCDSKVMEFGECRDNQAMQIKGKEYFVSDFVLEELGEGFNYINLYLSPKDYHRFHAPIDLKVKRIDFIQGALYPVNKMGLEKVDSLFVKNKRVVLSCEDYKGNPFYFVAVGALNVGGIIIHFAPNIATLKENYSHTFSTPICLQKGDEIGSFQMGSTIVMLSKGWCYHTKLEEGIYFGECIAKEQE
ncbi:phosphatidylserine decarboxylase [Helicobacter burdigaliensis]|uniref:phosphatidylserine decarboxylase n=1 Tax=Helicobacter burdigaliensis TaxID=2315334 RepID=UPI000EF65DD5|nr:phosphatidylserine decarboxylase [Helicobacter burdigaliensis]